MLLPFTVALPGLGTVTCTSWDDLGPARMEASRDLWVSEVIRLRGSDSICDPWDARTEEHGRMVEELGRASLMALPPIDVFRLLALRTRLHESVIGFHSRISPEHLEVRTGPVLWGTIFLYGLRLARDPGTASEPRLVSHVAPMSGDTGSVAWRVQVAAWIENVLDRPLATRGGRIVRIVEFRFPVARDGELSWTWPGLPIFVSRLQALGLELLQVDELLAAVRRPGAGAFESPDVTGDPQPLDPDEAETD